MKEIRIMISRNEWSNTNYFQKFKIVDTLPIVGDTDSDTVVTAVTKIDPDPENNAQDSSLYEYYRVESKCSDNNEVFTDYVAVLAQFEEYKIEYSDMASDFADYLEDAFEIADEGIEIYGYTQDLKIKACVNDVEKAVVAVRKWHENTEGIEKQANPIRLENGYFEDWKIKEEVK